VPKITVDKISPNPASPKGHAEASQQSLLHDTVQQVYAINRDDFNTREIAMVEPAKRGKFFDDLRKNYPVRREFQNTTVLLKQPSTTLETTLNGVGFKVKRQK
jgi:hypothetical protein